MLGRSRRPPGLAVLRDKRVLVAEEGTRQIMTLEEDKSMLKEVSPVEFENPHQLAALPDNLVLVLDREGVWVLNLDDDSKTEFDNALRGEQVDSISVRNDRVLVAAATGIHTYTYGDAAALASLRAAGTLHMPDVPDEIVKKITGGLLKLKLKL